MYNYVMETYLSRLSEELLVHEIIKYLLDTDLYNLMLFYKKNYLYTKLARIYSKRTELKLKVKEYLINETESSKFFLDVSNFDVKKYQGIQSTYDIRNKFQVYKNIIVCDLRVDEFVDIFDTKRL